MKKLVVSIILVFVIVSQVYCAELKSQGIIYSQQNTNSKIYNPEDYREEIIKEGIDEVVEHNKTAIIIPAGNVSENGVVSGKKEEEEIITINGIEYKRARPFNPKTDELPEFLKDKIIIQ